MTGDAVKIVIAAEDKASAQAMSAAKNIEASVKAIKETGQKAKASTEFIGILAGQLGGGQLASAAQQVAQITEKVGQFAEVQKLGGAGANMFKAGIAALVGVMSFQLGKSLGEAIFGVQELKDELAESQTEIDGFIARMNELSNRKFKEQLEDISLIKDPVKQQNEAAAAFQAIQDQINKAYDVFHHRQTELEKLRGQFDPFGDNTDTINQLQIEANAQNEIIANLEKQKWALSDLYGERANSVKQIKEQQKKEDEATAKAKQNQASVVAQLRKANYQYLELTKGIEAARQAQLADEGITGIDAERIILAERAADIAKKNADDKKRADDEEQARLKRVADLQASETQRLEEQRILLTQGEEAANRFRLVQEGLSEDAAARIAAEQAALDKQKKQSDLAKKLSEKPQLMAVEQRLVMRGASEDIQKDIASNTLKTVEKLGEVTEAIKAMPKQNAENNFQLEFVG
jgi:hypothetical protein